MKFDALRSKCKERNWKQQRTLNNNKQLLKNKKPLNRQQKPKQPTEKNQQQVYILFERSSNLH
jgi:hypothetical protein